MPGTMTRGTDRRGRIALGAAASALLFAFLGGAFVLLAASNDIGGNLLAAVGDPYLRSLVWFTLEQAVLSTLLSVLGAVPLALALHRIRFFGRGAVLRLFLLPQALPVLVGALAIIAVWGRNGAVSSALAALGLPRLDVYGLPGILIAHVFFNLPLAARLILSALDRVPAESWKLAGQLALPPLATFRLVEWPAIRPSLPGAASLIFMLCVTSFTLVLVLGGGPGATTLEVAIYQALRYDFDPGRAVALSLIQVALTAAILLAATRLGGDPSGGFGLGGRARRYDRPSRIRTGLDRTVLLLGTAFVLSPFLAVLIAGLSADLARLRLRTGRARSGGDEPLGGVLGGRRRACPVDGHPPCDRGAASAGPGAACRRGPRAQARPQRDGDGREPRPRRPAHRRRGRLVPCAAPLHRRVRGRALRGRRDQCRHGRAVHRADRRAGAAAKPRRRAAGWQTASACSACRASGWSTGRRSGRRSASPSPSPWQSRSAISAPSPFTEVRTSSPCPSSSCSAWAAIARATPPASPSSSASSASA